MGLGCKSGPKVVPNGSPENYCKVSNGHVIGHMLVGQNRGSTIGKKERWHLAILHRLSGTKRSHLQRLIFHSYDGQYAR